MPKFTTEGTNKSVLFVEDRKAASSYFLLGKAALKERLKGYFCRCIFTDCVTFDSWGGRHSDNYSGKLRQDWRCLSNWEL